MFVICKLFGKFFIFKANMAHKAIDLYTCNFAR